MSIDDLLQDLAKTLTDVSDITRDRAELRRDFLRSCLHVDRDRREQRRIDDIADLLEAEEDLYAKARAAVDSGDTSAAMPLLRQCAEAGTGEAAWLLAHMLEDAGNIPEATIWYQRACADGDARAGEKLAELCARPRPQADTGLLKDTAAMHPWLAGVQGHEDPTSSEDPLGAPPFTGHGTFVAGVARCLAPADIVVTDTLSTARNGPDQPRVIFVYYAEPGTRPRVWEVPSFDAVLANPPFPGHRRDQLCEALTMLKDPLRPAADHGDLTTGWPCEDHVVVEIKGQSQGRLPRDSAYWGAEWVKKIATSQSRSRLLFAPVGCPGTSKTRLAALLAARAKPSWFGFEDRRIQPGLIWYTAGQPDVPREPVVADVMLPPAEMPECSPDTTLAGVLERLVQSGTPALPVREASRVVGIVTLADVARHINDRVDVPSATVIARTLMRPGVSVPADTPLSAITQAIADDGIIVVTDPGSGHQPIGYLTAETVLIQNPASGRSRPPTDSSHPPLLLPQAGAVLLNRSQ